MCRSILISGASGFLGKHIFFELSTKFKIITIGRSLINHSGQHFHCDFSDNKRIDFPVVDYVIHCASKVHVVPRNEQDALDFFTVNVQGTQNLLVSLENNQSLRKFVFISSVAVYGLMEGIDITEDAPLLATDPYGKSKIAAEKLVSDWCSKRNIEYYILRLPLIAGKNAPGNLGAMVKAIQSGRYMSIGKALAKKSMILANDLAGFIANIQGPSGVYNLTDGYHPSFNELEHKIAAFYKKKEPFSLSGIGAKMLGFAGDIIGAKFPVNSIKLKKITSTLTFDDTKARTQLHWKSREVLREWEIE